jgi:mannose-1-phosphate guanylyltransferase
VPQVNGREHAWAIVLAGGDGLRLSGWTADLSGRAVPKQYCSFGRPRSMLRWALERACRVVPREHVLIVVAEQHRRFWEHELSDFPLDNIVVQPRNRGTGAGLLLPLLRLWRHRDAVARVLVLASDHYVEDERTLRESLDVALDARGHRAGRLLLLGMTPRGLDHDFGWIVPASRASGGIRRVAHFAEKPGLEGARVLMRRGALVNSLILVAPVDLVLRLYQESLPGILGALLDCPGDAGGREPLAEIYESIPTSDFSRHVLARSVRHLSVVQVPWCGWSDLGTPDRLRRFGFRRPGGVPLGTAPPKPPDLSRPTDDARSTEPERLCPGETPHDHGRDVVPL